MVVMVGVARMAVMWVVVLTLGRGGADAGGGAGCGDCCVGSCGCCGGVRSD